VGIELTSFEESRIQEVVGRSLTACPYLLYLPCLLCLHGKLVITYKEIHELSPPTQPFLLMEENMFSCYMNATNIVAFQMMLALLNMHTIVYATS